MSAEKVDVEERKLWLVEVERLCTEYGEVCVAAATSIEARDKANAKATSELVSWFDMDSERIVARDAVKEVSEAEGYAADIE